MFRKIIIIFALLCTINLAGCVNMLANMVANSFPTYEETVNSWPALDKNHSRIFLFSLDTKLYEIHTPFSDSSCAVILDGVEYGGILSGTFMFIDVAAGEHTLFCTKSSPKLVLNTSGGDIVYISGISPLKVVKIKDIQDQLKVLNHAFDEALPYDDQPFTIKRRSKQ